MLLGHNEYMSFLIPREIYHGLQWKTDKRFFAPMAQSPIGNVFLNDFVIVMNGGVRHIYHIQQFLCHVSYTLSGIYSTIICLFTGWL